MRVDPVRVHVFEGTKINNRSPSGFYWPYGHDGEPQSPATLRYALSGPDFAIRLGVSRNFLEPEFPLTMRQIRAEVLSAKKAPPAAHLSFELFRARTGRWIENDDFVDCCDSFSQATCEVAEGVNESGFDVEPYFFRGTVLHFRGMEVRQPYNGHGAGVGFAKLLLAKLVRTHGVHLVLLKPFPLQFEGAGRARDEAGRTLAQARRKLAAYYVRTLNCKPVGRGSDIYLET